MIKFYIRTPKIKKSHQKLMLVTDITYLMTQRWFNLVLEYNEFEIKALVIKIHVD